MDKFILLSLCKIKGGRIKSSEVEVKIPKLDTVIRPVNNSGHHCCPVTLKLNHIFIVVNFKFTFAIRLAQGFDHLGLYTGLLR